MRQNLQVDAGGIHLGDPPLTDIVEAFGDPRRVLRVGSGVELLNLGVEIVLLERDNVRLCRHSLLPVACHELPF